MRLSNSLSAGWDGICGIQAILMQQAKNGSVPRYDNYMEKKILLYTTGCPKCRILEKKLTDKGIEFEKIDDRQAILADGIEEVPALKLPSGIILSYYQAVRWVNGR